MGTSIDGLLLSKVEVSPRDHALTEPLLVVMAQGAKRLLLGDEVFEYQAGDYLIVTTNLPVTGDFLDVGPSTPALGLGLALRPAAVAPLLLEVPPARWTRPAAGAPALA